ncbi:MAG: thioredoxin-disulfide reductase [Firmicutes bacterium]|nr:thioredoxin-disulfide reductase [Bacillota bacterium]
MYNVIIIGAGPAGLSAGLYGARAGLSCAIIEKSAVGGLATTTANIENYPGVKSTDGFSLCYAMMEQAKQAGAEFVFDEATEIIGGGETKFVALASGQRLTCKKIIVTAGASPKKLNVEGESKFTGKGVSYCATCDGAFFKGKTVAVIGGGNTAVEDALYLEKLASKVYLVHRRDSLRADKILADRLAASTVTPLWNSVVESIDGSDKVAQITLKDTKTDTLNTVSVGGVFVAIGQSPNSKIFKGVECDEFGYIVTDEDMRTSVDGIFCAGDIRRKSLRQVVTACADGAIAASTIAKEIL